MIDDPVQVDVLIRKMKAHLPIPARGTGGMVRALRRDGIKMTSRQVQIVDVFDSGDEGGIMCALKGTGDEKTALVISLTHLRLPANHPIVQDVRSYQIARTQRLAQD
jgi:hypothetical protein